MVAKLQRQICIKWSSSMFFPHYAPPFPPLNIPVCFGSWAVKFLIWHGIWLTCFRCIFVLRYITDLPFVFMLFYAQINELSHVQIPIMLMPDDFKAYSKIKVDNHLFNK